MLGIGGLEGDIKLGSRGSGAKRWIVESMRCLIRAAGLPRTNSSLKERSALLEQAVRTWQADTYYKVDWGRVLGRWISGLAYLWQGKTSLAVGRIGDVDISHTQWLDLRVLIAGLRLELALHINHPELKVRRYEKELSTAFKAARSLRLASVEGLAERLIHWHPLAAAYAALMPGKILELEPATEAILRVGTTNSVHGIKLPPTYAAELILRSLDYDLRPHLKFVQADPGPSRNRRLLLLTTYGEVGYWMPSYSAISLIYGLKKASHDERAQSVFHEFGIIPVSSAEYAMLPLLDHVKAAVTELMLDKLTPKQFSQEVLQLQ